VDLLQQLLAHVEAVAEDIITLSAKRADLAEAAEAAMEIISVLDTNLVELLETHLLLLQVKVTQVETELTYLTLNSLEVEAEELLNRERLETGAEAKVETELKIIL
tara:strand:+ start:339 stop:656 length:318 start_codon:yes stop_codon:yes gene_type:complete